MQRRLTTLAGVLTSPNAARLDHIRKFVTDLFAPGTPHRYLTLHGAQHSERIETIIDDILALELRDAESVKKTVDPPQSFYLLASVWLHDTGLLCPLTESEQQAAQIQEISEDEWRLREHHKRSKKYVEDHAKELELEHFEANIIGKICEAHRGVVLTDLPSSGANLMLLGALIRAADELDVTRARAPVQAMEVLWGKMDSLSRWHWIKQYCIADAKPMHDVTAGVYCLRYDYEVCLPDRRLLEPFEERLMQPVEEALHKDHVNLILQTAGIRIGRDNFKMNPLISDPLLFDSTTLSDCLGGLLYIPAPLSAFVFASLEALQTKVPPAAELLHKLCQAMADAAFHPPHDAMFEIALIRFMDALRKAPDSNAIQDAHEAFDRRIRDLFKHLKCSDDERKCIAAACRNVGWFGWRLFSFALGDEATRRLHLISLIHSSLRPQAGDLLRWVKGNDPSHSVRQLAASALGLTGD